MTLSRFSVYDRYFTERGSNTRLPVFCREVHLMACNAGPDIIEDGLVFCLDAANINSYPKTGTTTSDLAGANDGTLTNGPTFDSDNRGGIVFDGSNDYVTNTNRPNFISNKSRRCNHLCMGVSTRYRSRYDLWEREYQ